MLKVTIKGPQKRRRVPLTRCKAPQRLIPQTREGAITGGAGRKVNTAAGRGRIFFHVGPNYGIAMRNMKTPTHLVVVCGGRIAIQGLPSSGYFIVLILATEKSKKRGSRFAKRLGVKLGLTQPFW